MFLLFHSQIPYKTGVRTVLQERRFLGGCGLKPEPHGKQTIDHYRHFEEGAAFLPGLKAEVSTPHIR
jgi:hypothetical protein